MGAPRETSPGHVVHVPPGRYETLYLVLATLFVAVLMLTNVIGTKLFALPMDVPLLGWLLRATDRLNLWLFDQGGGESLALTAGLITYPVTFLLTDVVSEVYGRRRADLMVLAGFLASLFMLVVFSLAKALPPSVLWVVPRAYAQAFHPDLVSQVTGADGVLAPVASHTAAQAAYAFTFDAPGTLLFASMTAYLCAQLVDNRLFHFWRRLTSGRHLWFRNNMSTTLSQLVDTIIVNVIFLHFYWHLAAAQIGAIVVGVYVVKATMALLDTPFCYLGVWIARRLTGGASGAAPGVAPRNGFGPSA